MATPMLLISKRKYHSTSAVGTHDVDDAIGAVTECMVRVLHSMSAVGTRDVVGVACVTPSVWWHSSWLALLGLKAVHV